MSHEETFEYVKQERDGIAAWASGLVRALEFYRQLGRDRNEAGLINDNGDTADAAIGMPRPASYASIMAVLRHDAVSAIVSGEPVCLGCGHVGDVAPPAIACCPERKRVRFVAAGPSGTVSVRVPE